MTARESLGTAKHYFLDRYRRHGLRDVTLIAALALGATAIDIYLSIQIGLLARPPYYDGIGYMLDAKNLFYRLGHYQLDLPFLILHPSALVNTLDLNPIVPLWQTLMCVSFLLLGESEWQSYTVRFWPTFLLLLLVFWAVRHRCSTRVAWVAVFFTVFLPTVSVNLRYAALNSPASIASAAFTGFAPNFSEWYLADLRPDLLFAVLLLWTVVPLLEHAERLDRRIWLVSGASAGLAILAKSSTLFELLLAWLFVLTYVFILNRRRLLATMLTSLWSLVPFMIIVTPWIFACGTSAIGYFLANFSSLLWSEPHATLLSETIYYWRLFPDHLGQFEGWVMLGIGLTLSFTTVRKGSKHDWSRVVGYIGLSAALYGSVSLAPAKNYFLGLPYYLLLWLFSWTMLAAFFKRWARPRNTRVLIVVLLVCLYAGSDVICAVHGLQNLPTAELRAARENRQLTQQIAMDLRAVLTDNDTFVWAPAFGYPAALLYYMVNTTDHYPQPTYFDYSKSPDQFVNASVKRSRAVLVYDEDIEIVAQYVDVHPVSRPYFRAIAEWVRQHESSYTLLRTYHLNAIERYLALRLYVKGPNAARDMTVGVDSWLPVVAERQSGPLINALLANAKNAGERIVLEKGERGEIYNIAARNEKKNTEIAKKVLRCLSLPEKMIQFVNDRSGHDFRYSLHCGKIQRLGWRTQVDFAEGLRKTIDWHAANRW